MTQVEPSLDKLVLWRRDLHQIPECGYEEHKTQRYLLDQLEAMKPDVLMPLAETGIKCVFWGKDREHAIAFRADIDALSVKENTELEFASRHEGHMHACGHDGHMAMALSTAAYAAWLRDAGMMTKSVTVIFQPAEESIGGAKRMIEEGVLENPHVDCVFGIHLMPDVPLGKLSCCPGAMMASTSEFDITLHGTTAHGAMPHRGQDAVAALCSLYPMIQTAISRRIDPTVMALFTAGKISAGQRRNIIADEARMECTVRTFSQEAAADVKAIVRDAVCAVESTFGVKGNVQEHVHYPVVVNDAALHDKLKVLAGDLYQVQKPLLIAEDYSYYQMHRPGVFYYVGCMDEKHNQPLHSDQFNFDERALLTGARMNQRLIDDYMQGG